MIYLNYMLGLGDQQASIEEILELNWPLTKEFTPTFPTSITATLPGATTQRRVQEYSPESFYTVPVPANVGRFWGARLELNLLIYSTGGSENIKGSNGHATTVDLGSGVWQFGSVATAGRYYKTPLPYSTRFQRVSVRIPPASQWSNPDATYRFSLSGLAGDARYEFTPNGVNGGAGGWVTAFRVITSSYLLLDNRFETSLAPVDTTCDFSAPNEFQIMCEDLGHKTTGQARNPSAYVSVGQGDPTNTGVDGVQWTDKQNGNTCSSSSGGEGVGLITFAEGSPIPEANLKGYMGGGAFNQKLVVTRNMTSAESPSLADGVWTCSHDGPGSLVLTGGATGTATTGNPVMFTISGGPTVVTVTPSSTTQDSNSNLTDTPVQRTFTNLLSVAADNGAYIANASHATPASGELWADFTFKHDLSLIASKDATDKALISFNGETGKAPIYVAADGSLATWDGTTEVKSAVTILKNVTYRVKVIYEAAGNFTIDVDGTAATPVSFAGWTFGTNMELLKGYKHEAGVKNVKKK